MTPIPSLEEAAEKLRIAAERLSVEAQSNARTLEGTVLRGKMGRIARDIFEAIEPLEALQEAGFVVARSNLLAMLSEVTEFAASAASDTLTKRDVLSRSRAMIAAAARGAQVVPKPAQNGENPLQDNEKGRCRTLAADDLSGCGHDHISAASSPQPVASEDGDL